MRMLEPIKAYFAKTPAVVCTAGSYIAFPNAAAKSIADKMPRKGLYELMTPEDVLRYEAHFENSRKGDYFVFDIIPIDKYDKAVALYGNLLGRRFAGVILAESNAFDVEEIFSSCSCDEELSMKEKNEFVSCFLKIPDEKFGEFDWGELVELESMGETVIEMFRTFDGFSAVSYDSSEYIRTCISSVSVNGYLQMVSSMMYAVNEMSRDRRMNMKLSAKDGIAELLVYTAAADKGIELHGVDGLCDAFPAAGNFIEICRYIANLESCRLSGGVDTSLGRAFLSVKFPKLVSDTVDFRCRKSADIYTARLRFIVDLMEKVKLSRYA